MFFVISSGGDWRCDDDIVVLGDGSKAEIYILRCGEISGDQDEVGLVHVLVKIIRADR